MQSKADYASWVFQILQRTSVELFVGTRIYPNLIPEDSEYPAISFSLVTHDTDDVKGEQMKVHRMMFQLNIFDRSYANARTIALGAREGLTAPTTVVNINGDSTFKSIYFKNATENLYDREKKVYHLIQDYEIRFA